jgi:GR25 family glycosyltransferase involved in LPS biosynthesis
MNNINFIFFILCFFYLLLFFHIYLNYKQIKKFKLIILLILIMLCTLIFFLFFTKKNKLERFESNKTNYLEGVDVIYWINLDRSEDRKKNMEKMFEDPAFNGKKIIRIPAVDGKAPDIDNIINSNFEKMKLEISTKIEHACTLSHVNALREFAKSEHQIALIMEDDMTLEYKPYWKKSIKEIMNNAPTDWDIIQLTYILPDNLPNEMYQKNNKYYWSTAAYIINKKNINIIPILPDKIKTDVPTADYYLYDIFNTYLYKYPMFIYENDEQSTIHQDHINHHNESKKKITEMLKNEVNL